MAQNLGDSLRELQMANGLDMAAVASLDGFVIEAAAVPEVEADSVCSVASNQLLIMSQLGQELGGGAARIATLEFESHTLLMAPLDDENLLVLLAGAGTNLGRMRIVLRRSVDQLRDALQSV
jgi:predicted regulator of Ras-like GTPase activity (Roadblock/LC7/MglB family)